MYLPIDEDLISRFLQVLADPPPKGRQKEQVVQAFLEENSVLIPMHNLENHGLHMDSIISKFPLGTAFTTDYAYLTKSSSRWVVTFVELEAPEKPIFTADMDRPTFSSTFNGAISQVEQWMHYVEEHRDAVRESVSKLLRPMAGNKLTFAYQLVIGRSASKNVSDDHKAAFEMRRDKSGIDIFTYDALISHYRSGKRFEKNVMFASKNRFAFKRVACEFGNMLAWIGPDALKFSTAQRAELVSRGYEMDAWEVGETLSVGGGKRALCIDEEVGSMLENVLASALNSNIHDVPKS